MHPPGDVCSVAANKQMIDTTSALDEGKTEANSQTSATRTRRGSSIPRRRCLSREGDFALEGVEECRKPAADDVDTGAAEDVGVDELTTGD